MRTKSYLTTIFLIINQLLIAQPKKGYHSHTYVYKEKKSNLYNKYQGVYDGDYKDKLRSGKGKFSFQNGDTYQGEWFMDDINGSGKMIYSNGDVYSGTFRNGLKNGNGIMNYTIGDMYEGEWVDGTKEGMGIYNYVNGNTYNGRWSKNNRSGNGVMMYSNGDKYDGLWLNDERNGQGTIFYKNGDKYDGLWLNDERNGQGTIFYKNGDKYVGQMKNNQISGNGTMEYVSGDLYKGSWSNNIINGHGELISNNQIYEGDFKNGLPDGRGKISYPSKYVLTGDFKNGKHIRNNETTIFLDSGKLKGNLFIEDGEKIFGTGIYYPDYPKIANYKKVYVENIEPAPNGERGFRFYNGEVKYTWIDNSVTKYSLKNDKVEGTRIYEGEGFKITSHYVNDKLDGEYYGKYYEDDGSFNTVKYNYTKGILNGPFEYYGLVGKFTNNIIQREIKWFKEKDDETPTITLYVAANKKPYITELKIGSEIWKGKLVFGQVVNTLKGTEALDEIFTSLSKFSETQTGTISCGKKKKVYKDGQLIEDIDPLPISEEELKAPYRCRCCNKTIYGIVNSVNESGDNPSEMLIRLYYAFYPAYIDAYKYLGYTNLSFKQFLQLEHFKFCSMKCSKICYESN